jgi:predicted DNA-binding antitoxin AbrB/MazE fold protein
MLIPEAFDILQEALGHLLFETAEAMKGPEMIVKVNAIYSNGTLTPLEPLNLEEGQEVMVSIDTKPQLSHEEHLKITPSSASPQRSALDILEEAPGHLLFKTAEDVKSYLKDERATWER